MAPTIPRKILPRFAGIAALWLLVVDAFGRISLGPISLSGALTIATAGAVLVYMPFSASPKRKTRTDKKVTRYPSSSLPWPLIAFLIFAWIRLWLSPSVEGIQNVAVYTGFIATAAVLARGTTHSSIVAMLKRFRFIAIIVPLLFIVSTRTTIDVYNERPFALTCLILLAVLIPYRGKKIAYIIGPILIVVAIFLSLSRTAAIIAAVLLIFSVVRSHKPYRFIKSALLASVVSLILYSVIMSYAPFRDRFLGGDQAANVGGIALNTSGRSSIWEITLKSAEKSPWFGQGPGSSSELIDRLYTNISHPHNDYLRLYHDFGAVGLGFFVLGILMLISRVWNRARRTDEEIHWVATIALIGVFIAAITDNVIVYPYVMVPLGVLAGCSLSEHIPKRPKTREMDQTSHMNTLPSPHAGQPPRSPQRPTTTPNAISSKRLSRMGP